VTRVQRLLLWSSATTAFVTGLAYACMRYLMTGDDPFSAYNHPAQPWALASHVLSAPAVLFVLGWFWGNHVAPKLKRGVRVARKSGVVILGLIVLMTASGYLLQTVTDSSWRVGLGWAHGISGSLFVLVLVAHLILGREVGEPNGTGSAKSPSIPTPHSAIRKRTASSPGLRPGPGL